MDGRHGRRRRHTAAAAAGLAGSAGWAHRIAGGRTRVRAGWCGSGGRNCRLVRAGGRRRAQKADAGVRSGVTVRGFWQRNIWTVRRLDFPKSRPACPHRVFLLDSCVLVRLSLRLHANRCTFLRVSPVGDYDCLLVWGNKPPTLA